MVLANIASIGGLVVPLIAMVVGLLAVVDE